MMKRITLVLLILLSTWHSGDISFKDTSLWKLHQYKYTELLRLEPFSWCPYKSYLIIDKYVEVKDGNNQKHLTINADIVALVQDDAEFNKSHARKYKGKPKTRLKKIYRYCHRTEYKYKGKAKTRLRKIYNYCHRTEYVAHVKFARNVFEQRQGDCAGISSAFYVLCKANKIPCRYVIGWTDTGCHAWNKVKIGKRWYWCDATLGIYMKKKLPKGWSIMEQW